MHPGLSFVPPKFVLSTATFFQSCCECFHAGGHHSEVVSSLWPDPWCPPILLAAAPRCTWSPLQRSRKLWDLTLLGFWSDNSQTLRNAPSEHTAHCWYVRCDGPASWQVYSDIHAMMGTWYNSSCCIQSNCQLHFIAHCQVCSALHSWLHWIVCSQPAWDMNPIKHQKRSG